MQVREAAAAIVTVTLLVSGCSSGSENGEVEIGEEVTELAEPTEEATDATEGAEGSAEAVSVEVAGLPIGGGEIVFDAALGAPQTQCASVNTTGFDLVEGVVVVIEAFAVPDQFAVSAGACGSAPPCLEGFQFTAGGSSCEVPVTWNGEPPEEGAALVASDSTVTCEDQTLCDGALEQMQASGVQSLSLIVFPAEETSE